MGTVWKDGKSIMLRKQIGAARQFNKNRYVELSVVLADMTVIKKQLTQSNLSLPNGR